MTLSRRIFFKNLYVWAVANFILWRIFENFRTGDFRSISSVRYDFQLILPMGKSNQECQSDLNEFYDLKKIRQINADFLHRGAIASLRHRALGHIRLTTIIFANGQEYLNWENKISESRSYNPAQLRAYGYSSRSLLNGKVLFDSSSVLVNPMV